MTGSYKARDVAVLLKDITGLEEPLPAEVREARIQAGESYANMLPMEYEPSDAYMAAFEAAMSGSCRDTARAVGCLCSRIVGKYGRGNVTLVSLARAGTPVGILLKHYMSRFFGFDPPHYTVSIIRGIGIDRNAMAYILARHPAESVLFVDGWTGKGAISNQLKQAMRDYPGVNPGAAVLSDPAGVAYLAGTVEDFLIPSACLNATVSGLLSRTFYRPDLIGPEDFHGAAYYSELAGRDVTYRFIDAVEAMFHEPCSSPCEPVPATGLAETCDIARAFGVSDLNLVKPGIGEATRVLLRRVPDRLLVRSMSDTARVGHLLALAREKRVPVEEYPLRNYHACGLIRRLGDI